MTTRDEIKEALSAVDTELAELRESILASPERPLLEGEWTVREALCHLAARSNSVPLVLGMLERARSDSEAGRNVARNIDEVNHGQIVERDGRSVQELLDEISAGHETERKAVDGLDEELLEQEFPNFRGDGTMPASQLLLMASAGHDRSHVKQIRDALG